MQDYLPLCVDLDGTLIKTDTLFESILILIKSKPFYIFLLPVWLLKGRAYLKQKITANVNLNIELLPYNPLVLNWLREEKATGRKIVLVTAADHSIANAIANYLGLFDEVLASNGHINLKGKIKQEFLSQRYGSKKYDYVGDCHADIAIWQDAHAAILVDPSKLLRNKVKSLTKIAREFHSQHSKLLLLKTIRVHQYIKNLLIFLPLMLSPAITDIQLWWKYLLGFISFCTTASIVYIINDLLDLEADRQHPRKRHRGFASGDISITSGIDIILFLLVVSISLCFYLRSNFIITLACYFLLTCFYSFYLKRLVLIDTFILSILYTIRLIAGITLLSHGYSDWLIAFSIFFFLCLAYVKRFTELFKANDEARQIHGRGYRLEQINLIKMLGISSGYIATLIFSLYIQSEKAASIYQHIEILYITNLVLLYWISYIWLMAYEGKMHDDPIVFAMKDKTSWIVGTICFFSILAAKFL
jgi:4-hydroxybenzoate polyprenyltransferase